MPFLEEEPSAVSGRTMTMRLPLRKSVYAPVVSVYAPKMTNPQEHKEASHNQHRKVLSKISRKYEQDK